MSMQAPESAPAPGSDQLSEADCDWFFPVHHVCAKIAELNQAGASGESTFDFITYDLTGAPIEAGDVFVDLWMTMGSHGHGSRPVVVTKVGLGKYHVAKVYFVMSGMWDLRLTLEPHTSAAETITHKVLAK
jgi:hypothetical protein